MLRTLKLEEFRLWGEHRDISLFLEWTHGDTETRRVCRIIIFVNHPSYFTRNTATKEAKKLQDHKMFVAGKLAMISFNPTFYQERSYESPAEFRRHQNLEEYARSLKVLEAAKTKKRLRRCNQDYV